MQFSKIKLVILCICEPKNFSNVGKSGLKLLQFGKSCKLVQYINIAGILVFSMLLALTSLIAREYISCGCLSRAVSNFYNSK